jgi:hypothetical protein
MTSSGSVVREAVANQPVATVQPVSTVQPVATTRTVSYESPVPISYTNKCETATMDRKTRCEPAWAHRDGLFGEFLLMRCNEAEVAYAVPVNGPIVQPPTDPIQVGPVAAVDPDYSSGFHVGGSYAFDRCNSVVVAWSHFESNTHNAIATDPQEAVIRPLVMHPSVFETNTDALAAEANLGVDYDTVDMDYRSLLWLGECSVVNWFAGLRYARLAQGFHSLFTLSGEKEEVLTNVNFDGGGLRVGLDAERHHCRGVLLYGKTSLSVVAGEFRATYFQGDNFDREVVDTSWQASRMLPIVDMELGLGWRSRCGRFRLTGGYNLSRWINTVTTDQWIKSVQENDFVSQPDALNYDTLSFDGMTFRAECRF